MKKLFTSLLLLLCISCTINAQAPQLWGMTTNGGVNGGGTIFTIMGDGSGFNSVFSFDAASGTSPKGSLIKAFNGKFYGTTNLGGSQSVGTVFCFDPNGNIFTKIIDFNYNNGAYGWGSLTQANNGYLYGNSYGGTTGNGNIFLVNPATNVFTPVYNLQSGNGASPGGKMVKAANGFLYGMTAYGGANSGGTIFSYNTATNIFTNLHDFNTPDGRTGYGSLLEASDGNLYGMTRNGGAYGVGVLFRFDPNNNAYTKLVDFDTTNGRWPWNGLMQASGTEIYGMTTNGGVNNLGVIFSYDYSSGIFSKHLDFDVSNGSVPFGTLLSCSDGNYYGMTYNGGNNLMGVSFRFDPVTDSLFVIHHFNGTDGANPSGDFIELNQPSEINSAQPNSGMEVFPNPTTGRIHIKTGFNNSSTLHVIVSNTTGQVLIEKESAFLPGGIVEQDLSSLENGIYFLQLTSGSSQVCKKIIKQ